MTEQLELELMDKKTQKKFILRYSTYGDKKNTPIVLIHGWLCNKRFWEDFTVIADWGYYLIVPDLRGHGKTDYTKDMALDSMADDVVELLDSLNIEKAIIIGHSMGGVVTQSLYHHYPEKVIALGLWDTGARIPFGYGIMTSFYVIRIISYVLMLFITYPINPLFRFVLGAGWQASFVGLGKNKTYKRYVKDVKFMNKKAVMKAAIQLSKANFVKKIADIKVPTLIFQGDKDNFITPRQLTEKLHAEIPDNEYYVFENAAHFVPNVNPELSLERLRNFLNNKL